MMLKKRNPFPQSSLGIASVLLLVLALVSLACQASAETRTPDDEGVATPGGGEAPNELYRLYFTRPDDPASDSLRGGPDKELADAIRRARLSVDVAAQQLNLWSIRDALINAHQRGVQVRVVVDSDYLDEPEVQEMLDAGISVLGDRRESRMHNKFAVIDRLEVWTGSMNFTINGAYRNHNDLLYIRSAQLAENYTTEFEEMFVEDRFGQGSPANTPHQAFGEGSTLIETYFSPEDGTLARLVELISQAEESVYFLAYSFTSEELAQALIERFQAGVDVAGVFEESQYASNVGTQYDKLRAAGLDVHLDGSARAMHHKLILIDEAIVITGSYNFSTSAETRNDENTLIIHRPDLASEYLSEFKDIFAAAQK